MDWALGNKWPNFVISRNELMRSSCNFWWWIMIDEEHDTATLKVRVKLKNLFGKKDVWRFSPCPTYFCVDWQVSHVPIVHFHNLSILQMPLHYEWEHIETGIFTAWELAIDPNAFFSLDRDYHLIVENWLLSNIVKQKGGPSCTVLQSMHHTLLCILGPFHFPALELKWNNV